MTPPILGIWASQISGHLYNGPYGAYDSLATITVPSGGVASITFSGIPTGYKHLQIRGIAKGNRTTYVDDLGMRVNADTGSSYSWHRLYGFGVGSGGTDTGATQTYMNVAQMAGGTVNNSLGFGAIVIDILDYTSTTKNKTVRSLSGYDDNGQGAIEFASGAWYNSSTAISSITLLPLIGTNIAQYSQFALYGVK